MKALEIKDLFKTYASGTKALNGLSFDIKDGEFFGLLGPNGSGKSTTINIISGPTKKNSGDVCVYGLKRDQHDDEVKMMLGIVPQEITFDSFLTVYETLDFQSGYYGIRRNDKKIDELLEKLSLSDKKHTNSRMLSGGMKRRLLIAKALVHKPKILILDEPTAGVDVELRHQLWEYISELNDEGLTILLTTHYLEEAETLCDRVAIINNGQLAAIGKTQELIKNLGDGKKMIINFHEDLNQLPASLKNLKAEMNGLRELVIQFDHSQTNEILKAIYEAKLKISDINMEDKDLEEVFLNLTYNKSK